MNKELLLESFTPGASPPLRETMLAIYGYGVTDPGFPEIALDRLEAVGCASAREIYQAVVGEWQREHDAMMRRVSEWYVDWSQREENRRDGEKLSRLKKLTRKQWTVLYQKLKKRGYVESLEEFEEMMRSYRQALSH